MYGYSDSGSPDSTRDCDKTSCSYPYRNQDGANFVKLLQDVRAKLSTMRTADGAAYLVTMAGPGGMDAISKMDLGTVCAQLDFVNIMT